MSSALTRMAGTCLAASSSAAAPRLGGALLVVLISEIIGVPIGIWAAYRGGWVDETITRIWDMLLAFPPLLLAFAVVAAFGPGLAKAAIRPRHPLCALYRPRRA